MGIVSRQSTSNVISLGTGVMIGAVSTIVVFPQAFEHIYEQWGIIQILISYAFLFSQFLVVGVPHIAVRYLPQFRGEKREGFLTLLVFGIPLAMTALFGLFYLAAPDALLVFFKEENQAALVSYLGLLVVLTGMVAYYRTFSGFANAHLRTEMPLFLSEIFVRCMVLAGALLFWYDYYSFPMLLWHYVGTYGLQAFILGLTLIRNFKPPAIAVQARKLREMTGYGLFATVDGAATTLLQYTDVLMLAYFVKADVIAFFTLGMFIGTLTQLPSRALGVVTMGLISEAWEKQNRNDLVDLYHKSSLTQMVLGGIILLLITFNLESLFAMMPEKTAPAMIVAIIIGSGKLINISFGVNGNIIVLSKKYIFNFYFNVILLVLTFLMNLWLIPQYGITGAAMGTALSLLVFNLIKLTFIWVTMKMQPFGWGHVMTIAIGAVTGLVGYYLPRIADQHILNIAYVSVVMALVYGLPVYFLKVSPDINRLADDLLRKVGVKK